MKEMVGGCAVCAEETGFLENPLVYCDGPNCNLAVHQACYGIIQVPTGPWFCRKCESQERAARVRCELCPSKDGALKRTDNGGWAHVVCALYIPEVRFGNVSTMEPIVLQLVPADRYHKTCCICEDLGKESKATVGACMQCNKLNCKNYFHVTCAQAAGLLCEEAGNFNDNVKYCGYCSYHYHKLKKDHHIKPIPAFKPIPSDNATPESSPEKRSPSSSASSSSQNQASGQSDSGKPPKKKMFKPSTSSSGSGTQSSTIAASPNANSNPALDRGGGGGGGGYFNSLNNAENVNNSSTRFVKNESPFPLRITDNAVAASFQTSLHANDSLERCEKELKLPEKRKRKSSTNPNTASSTSQSPQTFRPSSSPTPSSVASTAITTVSNAGSSRSVSSPSVPAFPLAMIHSQYTQNHNHNHQHLMNNSPVNKAEAKQLSPLDSLSVGAPSPREEDPGSIAKRPKTATAGEKKRIRKSTTNSTGQGKGSKVPKEPKEPSPAVTKKPRKKRGETSASGNAVSHSPSPSPSEAAALPLTNGNSLNLSMNQRHSVRSNGYSSSSPSSNASPLTNNLTNGPIPSFDMQRPMVPNFITPTPPPPPPPPHPRASPKRNHMKETSESPPQSLEQLLERQWNQGSQFVMDQAQHFDLYSLLNCLSQLRAENDRLEERVRQLVSRRDHLVAVNSRLALPLNGAFNNHANHTSVIAQAPGLGAGLAGAHNGPGVPPVSTFLAPHPPVTMMTTSNSSPAYESKSSRSSPATNSLPPVQRYQGNEMMVGPPVYQNISPPFANSLVPSSPGTSGSSPHPAGFAGFHPQSHPQSQPTSCIRAPDKR